MLDFYASSQNPGTGYVVGYVNHEGRYAKIKNDFGIRNNSTRMLNRIGAAAGKYFGKHILEGDLSYENRMYHRYGMYVAPDVTSDMAPGAMADYGDANIAVRFGDDFQDLSRVNFEIAIRGGLFFDHSEWPDYNDKARQTTLETHAKIARGFGRHRLAAEFGYTRLAGQKAIGLYNQQLIHAALRYGIEGGVVRLEAGADYYHDKVKTVDAENYIIPFVRLNLNLGTDGLCPFFEMDGSVDDNGFRSLTRQNPYVAAAFWQTKSSVDYNGRFGIGGSIWRGKFDYRVYAGFSVRDNHPYWYVSDNYAIDGEKTAVAGAMRRHWPSDRTFLQRRSDVASGEQFPDGIGRTRIYLQRRRNQIAQRRAVLRRQSVGALRRPQDFVRRGSLLAECPEVECGFRKYGDGNCAR